MKQIGLAGATAIGLGAIIGAGIFVLSGTTINLAGTGAIIAFLVTGLIALMYALEVSELTGEMPKEHGAAYSFAYKTFGSELGFITGVLTYVGYTTSVSAIATGFGSYVVALLSLPVYYAIAFSVLLIAALMLLNLRGARKAANVDIVLVSFKVAVLVIFIVFAVSHARAAASLFTGAYTKGFSGIFAASVIALFAYSGFQSIASITPNIKGGGKTAAKAIILAALISMVLYLGVTIAMLLLVPAGQFPISADPLGFVLAQVSAPSWLFILVGLAALVATASASLSMMLGGSRFLYQISADGLLPKKLSRVNRITDSPVNAILITTAISMVMLFSGSIYTIASIANFGTIFGYLMCSFALLKIRRLEKLRQGAARVLGNIHFNMKDVFRVPFYPYLPIFTIIATAVLLYGFPKEVLTGGIILILAALLAYDTLREWKNKPIVRVKLFT